MRPRALLPGLLLAGAALAACQIPPGNQPASPTAAFLAPTTAQTVVLPHPTVTPSARPTPTVKPTVTPPPTLSPTPPPTPTPTRVPTATARPTPRPTDALPQTPDRAPTGVSATLPAVQYPTWWSKQMQTGCIDRDPMAFGSPPLRLGEIVNNAPYGLMVGGHVIPSDHQGYSFPRPVPPQGYDVLAVADGEIVDVSVRQVSVETGKPSSSQYHIHLRHSCSIVTQYDLVDRLAPEIEAGMSAMRRGTPIPVKEGQVIGTTGFSTQGIDFWVADLTTLAPGYVVPQHYEAEPWRLYAIEPLTMFREPLRAQLREKSVRKAEPRGGRADYDIDGRLMGGWFVEGTGGYGGLGQQFFFRTHLAIAPHAYDPRAVIVSVGDFQGQARQFTVTGNGPDPALVDTGAGTVKYELRSWVYSVGPGGASWDYKAPVDDLRVVPFGDVLGTLLVQLVDQRRLKAELFPGKPAAEVTGFTDRAVIYER